MVNPMMKGSFDIPESTQSWTYFSTAGEQMDKAEYCIGGGKRP